MMKHDLESVNWKIPELVLLTTGTGYGDTELTAFDRALLDAGIGNLNLMKVTSVLPPGGRVLNLADFSLKIPKGALIPTVYSRSTSGIKGLMIASAIGIGVPEDMSENGMIFEASITGPRDEAKQLVHNMILEAFNIRNVNLKEVYIIASEMESAGRIACTLAAALLL